MFHTLTILEELIPQLHTNYDTETLIVMILSCGLYYFDFFQDVVVLRKLED